MYDIVDRPVDQLGPFERPLLGAMRRWVHAVTTVGGRSALDDDAFGDAMRLLDEKSGDDLVIQLPCHSTVGETEAVLLGLWRLVRDGRDLTARATAAMIVDPACVDALLGAMRRRVHA